MRVTTFPADHLASPPAATTSSIPPEFLPQPGADPLSAAFPKKIAVHPGLAGKPLTGDDAAQKLMELHSQPRTGRSACYVHLPFCETHCVYCGFFGGKYTEEKGDAYVDAVIAQLALTKGMPAVTSAPIQALYLGGGTPTALSVPQLERLLGALTETLPLAGDCELTVEGRIFNFTEEKMRACIDAGANRFSLGVQSFNTGLRRQLGRIESKESIVKCIEKLARFDKAAIVADLIYGLPGQSLKDWEEDINMFQSLPMDGVDLYQLNVFPKGKLHDALENGKLPAVATLPEQSRFFAKGLELMTAAGMRRLSMSHWGKTEKERNLYNPLAKGRYECLAYGAGAGGLLQGHFYYIDSNQESYLERVGKGSLPVAMLASPPRNLSFMRAVLGEMEIGRLNLAAIREACGDEAVQRILPLLEAWEQGGLLDVKNDLAMLTTAGQFWQVTLTQLLLSWYDSSEQAA